MQRRKSPLCSGEAWFELQVLSYQQFSTHSLSCPTLTVLCPIENQAGLKILYIRHRRQTHAARGD